MIFLLFSASWRLFFFIYSHSFFVISDLGKGSFPTILPSASLGFMAFINPELDPSFTAFFFFSHFLKFHRFLKKWITDYCSQYIINCFFYWFVSIINEFNIIAAGYHISSCNGLILLPDKTVVVFPITPGPGEYFYLFQKIIICSKILANLIIGFFY